MPRTKEQNEALRKSTREKIHTAAVKLFSEKGFAATGVQEIADNAGISIGLLYRHYRTKDEVFGALVHEALTGLEQIRELFESDMSPTDIFRAFTKEILNDLANNEEFLQFMMLLSQPFMSNHQYPWMKEVLERNKLALDKLACLIDKGQQMGQFRSGEPARMAQYFFSVIQGAFTMKASYRDAYIPPTAEMMTAFLFKEGCNEAE